MTLCPPFLPLNSFSPSPPFDGARTMTRFNNQPACLILSLCAVLSVFLAAPLPTHAQESEEAPKERAAVQNALDQYMEGLISQDAGRISLASEVIFVSLMALRRPRWTASARWRLFSSGKPSTASAFTKP